MTPAALVAVTVRVEELPEATVGGLADMVTVVMSATGLTVTTAVAVAGVVPAAPVAVAV